MKNKSFDVPLVALFVAFVIAAGMFVTTSVRQVGTIYKTVSTEVAAVPPTSQLAHVGGGSSTYGDLTGWGWSSNIGWVSFNSSNPGADGGDYHVSIATSSATPTIGRLQGYAWSPHVGWISFEPSNVNSCPGDGNFDTPQVQGGPGANLPAGYLSNNCIPRVDLDNGRVSGWARILSMVNQPGGGWLHLSGTNHPTTATPAKGVKWNNGPFEGYAWESTAVGWLSFAYANLNVSSVQTVAQAVDGNCTAVPSGTVLQNTTVRFYANPTAGTSPFTYQWGGSGPFGTQNYFDVLYSANGEGPLLTIKDSASSPTTKAVECPDVTTNVATDLELYIGPTLASANGASTLVRQGNTFALRWINEISGAYNCTTLVTNSANTPVSFWDDQFHEVFVNASSQATGLPTKDSNGFGPIPKGIYTFRINCTDTMVPPGPPRPKSVTLRIVSASGEEF